MVSRESVDSVEYSPELDTNQIQSFYEKQLPIPNIRSLFTLSILFDYFGFFNKELVSIASYTY
ncbi:hypothetical protein BZARG_252 [Bizionia argentinensis JUB59]|uniref:Uncharacterized protein n=1 Tax=Bizionia argentinensis JUB59 TaxID=1046627 RepID=G2E9P1_9FLAO|nr:hypothetical protein [Bizionia argentinensis]EGV45090.1 hypothetical protein BZARG_252 [Bizionia argentinensis JUB59]